MEIIKMENLKKQRKLKKLHIDLPKILHPTLTSRQQQKQNLPSQQLNLQLSPKLKNLRKLFFQYRSNARILQKSPYYINDTKNRQKIVEMISTRRYDLSQQVQEEIREKFGWKEGCFGDQRNNRCQLNKNMKKRELNVTLHYESKMYSVTVECETIQELTKKLTFQLARIMFSLKNTYKKLQLLLCYQSVQTNNELNYILSNPSLSIATIFPTPTNKPLSLHPVFITPSFITRQNVTLQDFKFIKCLGNGGFSTVYLVRGNIDNKYYAMKLINKKFIIDSQREGIVQNERFILGELSSGLVTGLEFAFETKNHFVLVVEYCPGGELFYQLKKVKRMKQEQAKFYFLEILCGLDYIHSKNIIYRDLKPQNLLLGIDGHVKIADFGLSKPSQSKRQLSYSFCGSPQYMAPEMLLKIGHNSLLDYYCLGALLYELVVGVPPYYSLNHEEIYQSILHQELSFPDHVELTQELKSLLRGLLQKNTKKRLGCMFGIKEILVHPWVGKVKQSTIQQKELEPPFMPDLQQFNFDLTDIKSDLEELNKMIEEDMIVKREFETFFSGEFYFQKPEWREKVNKLGKSLQQTRSRKILRKSRSVQNCLTSTRTDNSSFVNTTSRPQKSLIKAGNFCPHTIDLNANVHQTTTARMLRKARSSKLFNITTLRK